MRKILLVTSVLVGASALAYADAPSLKVSGGSDFQAGFTSQKNAYKASETQYDNNSKLTMKADITIGAEGKADSGMLYGGLVKIKSNTDNADEPTDALAIRRAFIFAESDMTGRIELGANDTATAQMAISAQTFAVGSGGIDGDLTDYVNFDVSGGGAPLYMKSAHLPLDKNWEGISRIANKVTYFTPKLGNELHNLQLGVSYTRDSQVAAGPLSFASKYRTGNLGAVEHDFNGTIAYAGQFDQLGVKASLSGETGRAKQDKDAATPEEKYKNVNAYSAGAAVSYAGFTIAGSYGNWDKSLNLRDGAVDNTAKSSYYTAGAAYENGPVALSVTYLNSERQNNKYRMVVVGTEYKLAEGFVPYVEFGAFKATPNATINEVANKGSVVLTGVKFNF